jgi:hypothetical protein
MPTADGGGTSLTIGWRQPAEASQFGMTSGYEVVTLSNSSSTLSDEVSDGLHAAVMFHLAGQEALSMYALGGGRLHTSEVYGFEGGLGVDLTLAGSPDMMRFDGTYLGAFVEGGYGSMAQESTDEWYSFPFVRVGLAFRPDF